MHVAIGVMGVVTETNTQSQYLGFYGCVGTGSVFRTVESVGRKFQECQSSVVDGSLLAVNGPRPLQTSSCSAQQALQTAWWARLGAPGPVQHTYWPSVKTGADKR